MMSSNGTYCAPERALPSELVELAREGSAEVVGESGGGSNGLGAILAGYRARTSQASRRGTRLKKVDGRRKGLPVAATWGPLTPLRHHSAPRGNKIDPLSLFAVIFDGARHPRGGMAAPALAVRPVGWSSECARWVIDTPFARAYADAATG